ncbi:MAG: hypothetical protein M1834_009749, partial [Cirrosporium novae-zelandiae]
MLDSLVRVSRRVVDDHYASIRARSAFLGRGGPHGAPGYNTPPEGGATFREPLSGHPNRCWPDRRRVHRGGTPVERRRASLVANASLSTISLQRVFLPDPRSTKYNKWGFATRDRTPEPTSRARKNSLRSRSGGAVAAFQARLPGTTSGEARPNTKLGLFGCNDARTGMPAGIPAGA